MRHLSWWDGNPLGSVVIDPARGIGTGTPTCHESVTPGRGRFPDRLDSNCASRTGPQRGHHQPARRGRLAVASEVLLAVPVGFRQGLVIPRRGERTRCSTLASRPLLVYNRTGSADS